AASATLRGFITGMTPTNAAKKMFGGDPVTEYVLRAASAPAEISTAGWAQELGRLAIHDLIASTVSLSAGADIIDRSPLKLNMDGIAEFRAPGRALNAAAAGQWVAEGTAAPVRVLNFSNAAVLRPRKLQVISVFTREMAESSNIEAIVKQSLGEATGLAIDLQMFASDPGDASKPPGLFAGITPITPSGRLGSDLDTMLSDLGSLFAGLAANGAGKTAVVIAA